MGKTKELSLRGMNERPLKPDMKTIKHIFCFLILSGIFFSCSDEVELRGVVQETDDTTLTIYLPNVKGAAEFGATRDDAYRNTRAGEEAEEATINDLWFFAYPVEGKGAFKSEKLLSSAQEKHNYVDDEKPYIPYEVKGMVDGVYHIYLLANLDSYLPSGKIKEDLNEDELQALILDFSTSQYLEKDNLPMACLNTEVKKTSVGDKEESGEFTFNKDNKVVYADLTFLCAKVRYTILFDKTEDGVSKAFKSTVDFTGASVTNVQPQTPVIPEGAVTGEPFGISDLTLRKTEYPGEESEYLKDNPEYEDDLQPKEENKWGENETEQRAWQGIVYLPENLKEGDGRTILHFEAQGDEVKSLYDLPLFKDMELKRGNFYDAIVKLETSQQEDFTANVSVSDWTTENLSYQLHGPYELIVENTEISVETGKTTSFWYETNANGGISFKIPTIPVLNETESKDIPFYVIKTGVDEAGKSVINVAVNPAIPYSDVLNKINNGTYKVGDKTYSTQDVNYFHIVAGNLYKEIKVNLSNLEPFLEVSPKEIIIDVREYVKSGKNSGEIEIHYETNITENKIQITIESDDDTNLTGNSPLTLQSGQATFSGSELPEAIGSLFLKFNELFSGNQYWTQNHSYTLTFRVEGVVEPEVVTITVKPNITDYVIHFKCADPRYDWDNPHVYIYQCLELPSDLLVDKNDPLKGHSEFAGRTVGYFDSSVQTNPTAALEYLFSDNISFRGWQGFGGSVNPYFTTYEDVDGFVHLGGYHYQGSGFNPNNGNTEYYNFETDFNSVHEKGKDRWTCLKCSAYSTPGDYNKKENDSEAKPGSHIFAGVTMERETGANEGWFKYTLSGVATPGKTLIIFYNDHEWKEASSGANNTQGKTDELHYRYPTKDQKTDGTLDGDSDRAGVSLFDYADHEGWFLFDGNSLNRSQNFQDDKPSVYRLYWPYKYGPGIYLTIDGRTDVTDKDLSYGILDSSLGYYYYEFPKRIDGHLYYNLTSGERPTADDHDGGYMNSFLKVGDNYCAYIKEIPQQFTPGKPQSIWNNIAEGDAADLYLRGEFNDWVADSKSQFRKVTDLTDVWRLRNVSLVENKNVKIGSNDWDINLGIASGSNNYMNRTIKLKSGAGTGEDIRIHGAFKGTLYLIKVNDMYYLSLVYGR